MRDEVVAVMPEKEVLAVGDYATRLMATPNKKAAEAMLEVGVNASTDITGFGLLGQARTMAKRSQLDIEIHTLPVIRGTLKLASLFGYGLREGKSAETSGGFLISVPENRRDWLVSALKRRGTNAYEVGVVKEGEGQAIVRDDVKVLEVFEN
jgi:selenide,water dikinase